MARFLMITGLFLIVSGLLLHFKVDVPYLTSWIGKLPGDIVIRKQNMTIYFPITTSVVFSVVLFLVLSFLFKSPK